MAKQWILFISFDLRMKELKRMCVKIMQSNTLQDTSYTRISENVVMYTTMGDIHLKLFPKE